MENCIFCKIIKGETPCIKVYEDEDTLVILDLKPNTKGHTLIIPKKHHQNLLEEDPTRGNKLLEVIQKIGKAQKEGLKATGINIMINIGKDAGQEIMHTHIHLIPRYEGDGLKHWPRHKEPEEERTLTAEKIISKL